MVYWFIIAKGYAPMAAENENTTLSSDRSKHFKVGIGEKTIEKLFNEDKMHGTSNGRAVFTPKR